MILGFNDAVGGGTLARDVAVGSTRISTIALGVRGTGFASEGAFPSEEEYVAYRSTSSPLSFSIMVRGFATYGEESWEL